jgi:hypothetical protein
MGTQRYPWGSVPPQRMIRDALKYSFKSFADDFLRRASSVSYSIKCLALALLVWPIYTLIAGRLFGINAEGFPSFFVKLSLGWLLIKTVEYLKRTKHL